MAKTSSAQQTPRSSAKLADDMRQSTLTKVIEAELTKAGSEYAPQIEQLEKQLEHAPSGSKQHLRTALDSLRQAQNAAQDPIKQELAKAIKTIANEYRLPIKIDSESTAQPVQASSPQNGHKPVRRSGVRNWIVEKVRANDGIKPSELKETAENEGVNTTTVGQTIRRLVGDGVLVEQGGGKRNKPLSIAS